VVAEDVFEVVEGQDRGARFALGGPEATLGRDPQVDFVLTDPRVSRTHAIVRLAGQELVVEDHGSTSGTAVNGRRISGPTALAVGDRVRIGATELAVLWVPGPAATEGGPLPTLIGEAGVPSGDWPMAEAPPAAVPPPAPAPEVAPPPPEAAPPPPPPPAEPPPPPPPAAEPLPPPPPPPPAPAHEPPPAYQPPPAPAYAPPGPAAGRGRPLGLVGGLVALAGSGLALASTWLDFIAGGSIWDTGQNWLRAQAIIAAGVGIALAVAWLVAAATDRAPRLREGIAQVLVAVGGFVLALPIFVLSLEGEGQKNVGFYLVIVGGALAAVGGILGLVGVSRARMPAPFQLPAALIVGLFGGVGGALAAVGGPLDWGAQGGETATGFDLGAGKWVLGFGIALAAASLLVLVLTLAGARRAAPPLLTLPLGLAGLVTGFMASFFTLFIVDAPVTAKVGALLAGLGGLAALLGVAAVAFLQAGRIYQRR
jgi:type III secretion system (T3SS) inner membrane Yop/YscD-like protein